MKNNGNFWEIMGNHGKLWETTIATCSTFASEIGNPTEILDTPKEILIIPRVFSNTPKENLVLTIKTFKNYGIGIEFDKEHE